MMIPMPVPVRRKPILSPELQRQLNAELRPSERILWAAQPLPRLFRWQSLPIVLFGIPWTAFALFWTRAAAYGTWAGSKQMGGGWSRLMLLFPLWGVPFILIGFGMLSAPYWAARAARTTVYAVTNQRALTLEGQSLRGVKVRTFLPDRLTSMSRTQRPDGSGDLIFEEFQQRQGSGTTTVRHGFKSIEDVRGVEELILSTLLAARTRAV